MQLISFLKNDTLFLKTQTLWFIYPILAFSDILTRKIILSFSDGSPVKKDIIKSYFSNSPHFRESSARVKMQWEPALCYANVPTSCKTKGCLHCSDPLLRVSHFLFVCLFVLFFVLFGCFFSARSHTTYLHDTKIHGMRQEPLDAWTKNQARYY